MHLKRLEIKGFKSFADNTEINLDPGINIVVGPNGCGKSNVVDAIRWVLGESNVRQLRGQKNEDVIFNGTDKKKALGMAQVDMTVDNADKSLPLDYGEVTVSRKIYRSGESEFYLNKARVRMKDVVSLYTDTGLGKRGYSIISQGELERVLSSQAFDRRLMLEEAAGTIKYRQQRDEVQQRILATAQNLVRVGDIIQELELRKDELNTKADKAQVYLGAWEEYQNLEKQVMANQIGESEDQLLAHKQHLAGAHASLQEITVRTDELHIRLQESEKVLADQRANLTMLKEKRYAIEAELGQMESEEKLSQERIKNYRERIQAALADREKYALMLGNLDKDLEARITDFQQERKLYQERMSELECLQQEINELEKIIAEQEADFELHRRLVFEQANKETGIKNEIMALEDRIKKSREKRERLLVRAEENDEQIKSLLKKASAINEQRSQRLIRQKDWQTSLADSTEQKGAGLKSQARLDEEYSSISPEILNLENRLQVFKDARQNYSAYSEGVRAILKAHDRGEMSFKGIKGLVGNLIEVPAGMEQAIDVVLGRAMENMVVETAESARRAIDFLKQHRLGRVTFLPLDVLRVPQIPTRIREQILAVEGVLGLASDLLKYAPEYEAAIVYLLGGVLLVQDLDCGLKVFKQIKYPLRIVTLDGEFINASGAMTGGVVNKTRNSLLQRNREEKSISQQLEVKRLAASANRKAASELDQQIKDIDARLSLERNGLAEVEFQLKLIDEEEQHIQASLQTTRQDQELYRTENVQLENSIEQSENQIMLLNERHNRMGQETTHLSRHIEKIKAELEINRRDYEVRKERFSSHQEQIIMKEKELENTERNIRQFEDVKKSYHQSGAEAQALQERLQKDVDIHQGRINDTLKKTADKQQELDIIVESIIHSQRNEMKMLQDIDRIRAEISPLQQQIQDIQGQLRNMEMKEVRLETELDGSLEQWRDKFVNTEPALFRTDISPRQMREFRTRIGTLREQIDLLGPVDIDAIKEYDEIRERYDFLCQQAGDLSAARQSLDGLLQETEKIMTKNFSQFMMLADESFKRTFMEIFNGGEASLNIESGSDLTSGVDIIVKMPGKRSQSLNLLSGGERALTCIAFIFALLRLKPAPFCLLDEIDASLDETNLMRFADFLKGMARETQFIVITHRQATIEAGSNIYGITMPQEGISSILSIHCDEIDSLAG